MLNYSSANNTFNKEHRPDPARRINYEIGDSKQPSLFYPQVKFLHWDNECNFSLRLTDPDYAGATVVDKGESLEWNRGDRSARFYEHNPHQDEDGGFEFEIELASRPLSNVLEFTFQSKGLSFRYQPPLTERQRHPLVVTVTETEARDIDGKIVQYCPEDAVGSYSVRHASRRWNQNGGKHYRTGKAFHIYRPHATDALGNRVWCKLNINRQDDSGGFLTITIPQSFLDAAAYPVIVDPTFGNTARGASSVTDSASDILGALATAPASGTVDSISVWANDATANLFKGILVLQSSLNIVTNGVGDGIALPTGSPPASATASTMSTPPSITSGLAYYLCGIWEAFITAIYYDVGSAGDGFVDDTNNFTTPTNPTDGTTDSNAYSFFGTYTATGGDTLFAASIM